MTPVQQKMKHFWISNSISISASFRNGSISRSYHAGSVCLSVCHGKVFFFLGGRPGDVNSKSVSKHDARHVMVESPLPNFASIFGLTTLYSHSLSLLYLLTTV